MKYYLAIDPGLSGALAYYDPATKELIIHDMPTLEISTNKKKKREINLYELSRILDMMQPKTIKAVIEQVGSSPQQGVTSAFNFGQSVMAAKMGVAANFIPMTLVTPTVWKRAMGVTADKDTCFRAASRLLPAHCDKWARKRDDGRAEAALLAVYAAQTDKNKLGDIL